MSRDFSANSGLAVRGLTIRFGGLVAVDGVDLDAPAGEMTGLIGPNGAGKTTMFNACSGLVEPARGTVHLLGEDISRLGPAARAQRGLGRTFQRMELFDSLTVRENIALGREASLAGSSVRRQLLATRRERVAVAEATSDALGVCQIEHLTHRLAGALSTGERRLVELARALAGQYRILLLDEPSSGLDAKETERFGTVLQQVVRDRGTGILLVEHDMALVMRVCAYAYVLDFAKLIFEGTVDQVRKSDIVRAAYLGSEAA